jgi:hypothetical protein
MSHGRRQAVGRGQYFYLFSIHATISEQFLHETKTNYHKNQYFYFPTQWQNYTAVLIWISRKSTTLLLEL